MIHRQFPPEEHNPDDVADGPADSELADFDFRTEGPEGESRQFNGLHAERDSNYGDTHEDTGDGPEYGTDEASENEP